MSLQQFNDFVAACRATDYWPVAAQKGHVNLYEVAAWATPPEAAKRPSKMTIVLDNLRWCSTSMIPRSVAKLFGECMSLYPFLFLVGQWLTKGR